MRLRTKLLPSSKNSAKKEARVKLPFFRFDRFGMLKIILVFLMCIYGLRLFNLEVLSYSDYKAAADGGHTFYRKLLPKRGEIFVREYRKDTSKMASTMYNGEDLFPAVTNREYGLVYATPKLIDDPDKAASLLAPLLELNKDELLAKLSNKNDSYEPLKRKVQDSVVEQIEKLELRGIGVTLDTYRFYPEKALGGQLFGFMGQTDKGAKGQYGIEGYFNDILKGKEGSLKFETDGLGAFIPVGDRHMVEAQNGDSVVLTIDRVVQMTACEKLKSWVTQHGADGGSIVIMNPQTGAVIAMCNAPDFDPSDYGKSPLESYSNSSIFTAYEPGSIFKPITVAIATDLGLITPDSTFNDTGSVSFPPYTIRNSDKLAHGVVSMTEALNESLNTVMVHLAMQTGLENFRDYVKKFGFGSLSGIELDTESMGNMSALNQKIDINLATASFGQAVTTTPLQMTTAYATLANGGVMMQPYIVDEIIKSDGTHIKTQPKVVRRVVSERTATLVDGMLVAVVRRGHGKKAGVPQYYVAGKTGTAQVPRKDGKGYEANATIGSFAGFAPVDHPRFAMLVKIDHPRDVSWAESSAAPLFGDMAKFLLQYYEVPPDELEPAKK